MNSFNEIQGGGAVTIRKAKPAKVIQEAEELDEDGNNYESRLHMYPIELLEIKVAAV